MFGPPPPVPPAFVVIGPPQFGPAFKPTHGDARGLIYGLPPGYAPAPNQNRKQTLLLNQLQLSSTGNMLFGGQLIMKYLLCQYTLFRNKVKLEKLNYYAVLYCLEGIISNEETDEIVISKIIRNNSVKEQARHIFYVLCVCSFSYYEQVGTCWIRRQNRVT